MKFERTYKVTVELYDEKVDDLIEICGETREIAIEEYGSVEEWLIGYVEDSIFCNVDHDEEYIKTWDIDQSEVKRIND